MAEKGNWPLLRETLINMQQSNGQSKKVVVIISHVCATTPSVASISFSSRYYHHYSSSLSRLLFFFCPGHGQDVIFQGIGSRQRREASCFSRDHDGCCPRQRGSKGAGQGEESPQCTRAVPPVAVIIMTEISRSVSDRWHADEQRPSSTPPFWRPKLTPGAGHPSIFTVSNLSIC